MYVCFKKNQRILQSNPPKENLSPITLQFISDNPRNKNNKANEEELDILNKFKQGTLSSYQKVFTNDRGEKTLYYATKGTKLTENCLSCHGKPQDAPAIIKKEYGKSAGFLEILERFVLLAKY